MMSAFKNLFHVCMFCNDIEKSLAFYQGLGCELAFNMAAKKGEEAWNYYLKICEGQYIELQPCKAPNPHPHPEESRYFENQTIWHFSLETDNMVEMIDALRKNGIAIYASPDEGAKEVFSIEDTILSPDGCFVCWVVDPDGTPIELMEQSRHSLQRLADIRMQKKYS